MVKYSKDDMAVIWLDSFVGLEHKNKVAILEQADYPAQVIENLSKFCTFITKITSESLYNNIYSALNENYINSILFNLEKKNIKVITKFSTDFPQELIETPACPIILYCMGNTNLLKSDNKFSIVGSRKTIPIAIKSTEDIARQLSENNFTIVTGLAEGGDTAAIKGALPSGNIISVLAYGFDYVYPEFNRNLLKQITEKGLVITEHTPDTAPLGFMFPIRNRIIAGLSKATLIISGGERSGTYYTADYAVEYNRDLFAFPYSIGVSSGAMCNAFIKKGAILTESVLDIAVHYGINFEENKNKQDLTDTELKCYNIIKGNEMHLNDIMKISGLKIYEIMPILSSLEIKKMIIKSGANIYSAR